MDPQVAYRVQHEYLGAEFAEISGLVPSALRGIKSMVPWILPQIDPEQILPAVLTQRPPGLVVACVTDRSASLSVTMRTGMVLSFSSFVSNKAWPIWWTSSRTKTPGGVRSNPEMWMMFSWK
ncbi:MAG: hypothetical protein ACRDN0_26225 [Trebonia sp.]